MSHSHCIRSRFQRGGFTLVELLVVIGIIALLISILLPSLVSARRQAKAVACLSNQRQLGTALMMFVGEHDNWLPKAWFNDTPRDLGAPQTSGNTDWGFRDPRWGWEDVLASYMGEGMAIFRCPADSTELYRNVADNVETGRWNVNYPGVDPTINDFPGSYRYNISNHPNWARSTKIMSLDDPSSAILVTDAIGIIGQPGDVRNFNQVASWGWELDGVSEDNMRLVPVDRHNEVDFDRPEETRLGFMFADGHAAPYTWRETWERKGDDIAGAGEPSAPDYPTMWRQNWERDGANRIWWNRSHGAALPGTLAR